MTRSHMLSAEALTIRYRDRIIVPRLDLVIPPGRITAIVGPNGCGKSTLLKALTRLIPAKEGRVVLDGTELRSRSAKDLARTIGLLPQSPTAPEGIAVADLVSRGRHPHQKAFARFTAHDGEVVAGALAATGTAELADRPVDELSGGQRQRVWIAMALAQETDILLLDEPTTFLDLSHQIDVLDLLADLNQLQGTTIVMVLHDINLAARYADHLIAMRAGEIVADGPPGDVLTEELISEVFDLHAVVMTDPVSGTPIIIPRGRHHLLEVPATPAIGRSRR